MSVMESEMNKEENVNIHYATLNATLNAVPVTCRNQKVLNKSN